MQSKKHTVLKQTKSNNLDASESGNVKEVGEIWWLDKLWRIIKGDKDVNDKVHNFPALLFIAIDVGSAVS